MMNTEGRPSSPLRKIFLVALIAIFFASTILLLYLWEKNNNSDPDRIQHIQGTMEYNGAEYLLRDNVETFLIMGLDTTEEAGMTADSYNNNALADFLLLLVFDKDSKKCSAIHINRDSMVEMNVLGVAGQKVGTVNGQIALAHTYGNGKEVSCRNTSDAVSQLLCNVKINHYISVKMNFVPIFNDLVGGVEVTLLDDFTSFDETMIEGETIKLTGEQALRYVRSRQGLADSTNSNRMVRQRQYLNALYGATQARMEADEQFIVDASVAMSDYIVSDRSVTQLQELARRMLEYEFTEITALEGESRMGEEYVEFYPNEDFVKSLVVRLFYQPKQ